MKIRKALSSASFFKGPRLREREMLLTISHGFAPFCHDRWSTGINRGRQNRVAGRAGRIRTTKQVSDRPSIASPSAGPAVAPLAACSARGGCSAAHLEGRPSTRAIRRFRVRAWTTMAVLRRWGTRQPVEGLYVHPVTGWFRYAATNPGTCNDTFGSRAPLSDGSYLGSGTTPTGFNQSISNLSGGTTYR